MSPQDEEPLPFATSGRALGGEIRARPEDFRVEEVPAYLPSGDGDHLFVLFEKRDLGTEEAVRRLARALDVPTREAGWAGLKDRRAVTRQWASFLFGDPARLEGASIEGVTVLRAQRHRNKLRTGHLRGNRFTILLRGALATDRAEAQARLADLAVRGVPNAFGPQRFGRHGANRGAARQWLLEGGPAPRKPFQRKLLVSVLQSDLFHRLLRGRMHEGTFASVIEGDLCRREDSGGLFVPEDLAQARERAARFEVSATGPMFGARMRWPEGEARRREAEALAAAGLEAADLARFRRFGPGTRRPYRVQLGEPSVEATSEGLRLLFSLPPGAYATVVLRELTRRDSAEPLAQPPTKA
ncbi:MAG: tRNA pseudouridine(13) synthase TruD [Sandaracinaceae bacterium]